jgi:hypothetical protein
MKYPFMSAAAALGVAAIMVATVAEPASARNRWIGPAAGFAAGVAVGSAVANSYNYGPYYGYYGYGAYAYDPYYGSQAYVAPAYPRYYGPYYPRYRECNPEDVGREGSGC